jgi:hypothetical protein
MGLENGEAMQILFRVGVQGFKLSPHQGVIAAEYNDGNCLQRGEDVLIEINGTNLAYAVS